MMTPQVSSALPAMPMGLTLQVHRFGAVIAAASKVGKRCKWAATSNGEKGAADRVAAGQREVNLPPSRAGDNRLPMTLSLVGPMQWSRRTRCHRDLLFVGNNLPLNVALTFGLFVDQHGSAKCAATADVLLFTRTPVLDSGAKRRTVNIVFAVELARDDDDDVSMGSFQD
ncbi:hypothetical protein WI665_03340 [Vibrio cholerae]